tara:strand:+ start:378 stop:551 length:174 start_codon:yes stop_codon:yes gene_type:complete
MNQIEYTLEDVQRLIQVNKEFALALENVVLKRMLEQSIQDQDQKWNGKKVKAVGTYS